MNLDKFVTIGLRVFEEHTILHHSAQELLQTPTISDTEQSGQK
jgi:hypothetical protein